MTNQIHALSTFAFLKANFEKKESDYIDLFIPIIRHCLSKHALNQPITREGLQRDLKDEFGITIPLHCWELILERIKRTSEIIQKDRQYFLSEKFKPASLSKEVDLFNDEIESLANKLSEFALTEGDVWEKDSALSNLLDFCEIFGAAIYINDIKISQNSKFSKEVKLVGRFVDSIKSNDIAEFNKFLNIVKGYIIGNVLTLPNTASIQTPFDRVIVYLDTRIVLNLLGLGSPQEKKATNELVNLLRAKKTQIKIFNHTRSEILGILNHCITDWDTPEFDRIPALLNSKINQMHRSDLMELTSEFDKTLKNFGIVSERASLERPKREEEATFFAKLKDNGGYSLVGDPAVAMDVKSYFDIMRLRESRDYDDLASCQAILITDNSQFAKVSASFSHQFYHHTGISCVITELSASIIAWLNSPLDFDLPADILISLSIASFMPTKEFWDRFVVLLKDAQDKKIVDAETLNLFRVSPHVKRELANFTKGRDIELSTEIIPLLAEGLRAEIIQNAQTKFDAETSKMNQIISELTFDKGSLSLQYEDASNRAITAHARAITAESKLIVSKIKSKTLYFRITRMVIKISWCTLVCGTAINELLNLFFIPTEHKFLTPKWLLFFSSISALYFLAGRFIKFLSIDWLISKLIPSPRSISRNYHK